MGSQAVVFRRTDGHGLQDSSPGFATRRGFTRSLHVENTGIAFQISVYSAVAFKGARRAL